MRTKGRHVDHVSPSKLTLRFLVDVRLRRSGWSPSAEVCLPTWTGKEQQLTIATNNQANHSYVEANPEDEDPPYAAVASNVAIQTAKPKIVEEVANLQVGQVEGNRVFGCRLKGPR